ncbi:ABC transporter ATP-binding protein [Dictyobacter aurantiacus]|uniref:ABC transporter n=1 Tax=Dictyobacter aurantiacus TaxID=1936993 RepID=A0A401ZH91_9CHLR|nr:ABC transporter ATP-binding protein [Dictyobacter aurantiacus]GCE06255.1 ABC transporter [Dictyobacter aurantiacus]
MQNMVAPSTKAPTTESIIKIQNVSKRYHNTHALRDINLEIPRGTIYGLIGPNGAGKTTLLRILAALLTPSSGQVWIEEQEVTRTPSIIQRKVGYMPDFFGVYPDLTSAEYLEFYAGIHGIPRQKRAGIVTDLLELVELSSKREAMVETLSRGMKQRLCLARALVHDPDILLLDEPASGLDPRARVELRELVRTLQGMGKTILISSHILLELAEMCTDIAIIQNGQLVIAGDVERVTHQLGGARQVEIRLLDNMRIGDVVAHLENVADIHNITTNEDRLIQAEFSGDDETLHHILAALITQGYPVVSFAPRSGGGRLEEVFMNITERGNQA